MPGLLKGRVAVITGAGRGLGRAHALAMAQQGAKVVVDDLGGGPGGGGMARGPADEVVQEIRKSGGAAVASYASVADPKSAESIINAALDNFGKLDILVNNAGILRDRMVFNMTDDEWDLVVKVHLYGTFYCTREACRIMRQQRYGRIINTSSIAGMGNMGQANYAAAKEGIIGFTRVVAKDVARYGITCNAIRPRAATRLTITDELYQARIKSMRQEAAEAWRQSTEAQAPEDVSPLVVYLATEQAGNVTGCVFDSFRNFIAIYDDPPRFWKTIEKKENRWLAEELVELMPKTLTGVIQPQLTTALRRITPDAKGWEWAAGVLKEATPVAR